MMKKFIFIIVIMFFTSNCFSQIIWKSPRYNYTVEIPSDFKENPPIGKNVDLKVLNGNKSIVIVVRDLQKEAPEAIEYSLWDMLGDLDEYMYSYEYNSRQFVSDLKIVDYGQTKIDYIDSFWFHCIMDSGLTYQQTYMTKVGKLFFSITFSCVTSEKDDFVPIWFRFVNQIKFNYKDTI